MSLACKVHQQNATYNLEQSVKLHDLVEDHNKVQVTITVKGKGLQELESRLLVPGDVLILPGKTSLPCDAVLIDGSCVVNEGMLTGESIPVTKTPLPQTENTMPWKSHSLEDYRKHVLFCGTEVIQVKPSGQGPVRAVVLQTGYNTAKGDLVRSILYPRPLNFKLYNDAFKFMVFLACMGVVGFFYALGIYMYHEVPPRETATMALILLTATVPPVLPAALTIGQTVPWGPLCAAMTSCHSLILLDGTIQGDPLDLKMFEGTGWSPVDAITILRQFPFSSALQRMSVIAQLSGDLHPHVYMKGAPEMVARFCRTETVPKNFPQELKSYTVQGFRVIALAHKTLKMEKLSDLERLAREKVESELAFLGLLIMENRLKKETKPVLKELSEAHIRTVMITGDNLQTAITVAKNSEMIPVGSQVIIVEANEPGDLLPASVTWQLVGTQEPSPGKKVRFHRQMTPPTLAEAHFFVHHKFAFFRAHREGRAALVSSFGVFKYLTMYGIIQFIGTSLLYWV
ncbi:hypothetical protein NN561_014254 [Cricetulus griseus]